MTCRTFLGLCVALACGLASAAAQERLALVPRVAPADKPFKVALPGEMLEAGARSPDSGITYHWKVTDAASGNPFPGDAGIENLADGKIATPLPILLVKTPVRAKYRFEVIASNADEDARPSIAEIDLSGDVALITKVNDETAAPVGEPPAIVPMPAGQPPAGPPQPGGAAPTGGAADLPSDLNWPRPLVLPPGDTRQLIEQRLKLSRQWWSENVIKEFREVPTVSEEFIVEKLTEDRDRKFSLKEEIDTPLIAAARFYRAAYAAADTSAERAQEVWKAEREQLLKQMEDDDLESQRALLLSRHFLEDLEAEIASKSPMHFGAALREAAMMIGKILLAGDEQARKDLNAAPGPRGTAGEATFSPGGGYYGTSHAAVHHARSMSRIRMRSERRIARIQSFP